MRTILLMIAAVLGGGTVCGAVVGFIVGPSLRGLVPGATVTGHNYGPELAMAGAWVGGAFGFVAGLIVVFGLFRMVLDMQRS